MADFKPLDLFCRFCFLTSDITTENQSNRRLPIMVKSCVLQTTGLDRMSVNENCIEISFEMRIISTIYLKPSWTTHLDMDKSLYREHSPMCYVHNCDSLNDTPMNMYDYLIHIQMIVRCLHMFCIS